MLPAVFRTFLFGLLNTFDGIRGPLFKYKDAVIKAHKCKQQLKFLKKCLHNGVVPRSLLPRRLCSRPGRPFSRAGEEVLLERISQVDLEMKQKFYWVRRTFEKLNCFIRASELYGADILMKILDYVHYVKDFEISKVCSGLNVKFDRLFRESPWVKFSNVNLVINLSNFELGFLDKIALGFGYSFCIGNNNNDCLSFLESFEKFKGNCKISGLDFQCLKGIIFGALVEKIREGWVFPEILLERLKLLKRNKEIIVTKADKGNKIVILNREEYIEKMDLLLGNRDIYKPLRSDPLKADQRFFNKELNNILFNLPDLASKFNSRLPTSSYMYGLPKVHKDGVPMRPIISTIGSVSYSLSKWLAKCLSKHIGCISTSNVINSVDFIDRIGNLNMQGKKMVSFDVVSLFTNVPIDLTLDLFSRYCKENKICLPLGNNVFFDLLRLAVTQSNFVFNGRFYKQVFGLAMGNPLSPILSNIFMECMEKYMLKELCSDVYWLRYVDDTFVVMNQDVDIVEFLNILNSYVDSIKFTYEEEVNGKLAFLDVSVIKNERGGLEFCVYRKPTHSDNYLHGFSEVDVNVKIGVISGMVLRAFRICSPPYLTKECDHIKKVFEGLGYSDVMIKKGFFRGKQSFYKTEFKEKDKFENVLVVPRCDLKEWNLVPSEVKLVFKKGLSIGDIVKTRNNTKVNKETGIYGIPCDKCDKIYIGETDRFSGRMRDHIRSKRVEDRYSSLVSHELLNPGHTTIVNKADLVIKITAVENRRNLEAFLISNCNTFNLTTGSERLSSIDCNFLNQADVCRSGLADMHKLRERWKLEAGL